MEALKIALCDDDTQERAYFYNLCKKLKERKRIQVKVKEYERGDTLLFDFQDSRIKASVDIVLLDINMPGTNGIDVAKGLRNAGFQGSIIFVTKSKRHWKSAFDVKAFHYITKDEDAEERFLGVLAEAAEEAMEKRDKALLFSAIDETRRVNVASISHFEVSRYMVRVYYGQDEFEFTSSLAKIEQLLSNNENFMKVNRAYLLSLSHIERYDEKAKNVVMQNGIVIPVSRNYSKKLKTRMTELLNG
ncbi:MAG: LytTR family DNA-binding domain-containing protein [Lachnospiraceae bacterium]|nr:LytTR family DNA-binding domain-containing protein [Lachnospiraceae bacterium]